MAGADNYSDVQQPPSAYGGQEDGGYTPYQQPPSAYGEQEPQLSTLVSGLGNGVNLQPSYYNGGDVDLGWPLMCKSPKIKAVRIEIEPNQVANATRWIKEAVTNGYTVIATYHSSAALGSDDENELLKAGDWWAANYATLKASGSFTVNLMNEWGSHGITAHDFAATCNKAIAKVRTVYDGPIVVDLPGFGQEAHIGALAVKGGGNAVIADPRIILSAHIYPGAWNGARQREMTVADIDELTATGIACMVGEFGDDGKGGKTRWRDLVNQARSKGWPVFGWAWNGDGSSPVKMNMIEPQFQPFVTGKSQSYTPGAYFNTIYDCL